MKKDTANLLRECSAGIKMGERAISLALMHTPSGELKNTLVSAGERHAILGDEIKKLLYTERQQDKDPSPIINMMSDVKMKAALALNGSKATVASLITDGCNMGVKSISHYLNKYPTAGTYAQALAQRIIRTEDELRDQMKKYL